MDRPGAPRVPQRLLRGRLPGLVRPGDRLPGRTRPPATVGSAGPAPASRASRRRSRLAIPGAGPGDPAHPARPHPDPGLGRSAAPVHGRRDRVAQRRVLPGRSWSCRRRSMDPSATDGLAGGEGASRSLVGRRPCLRGHQGPDRGPIADRPTPRCRTARGGGAWAIAGPSLSVRRHPHGDLLAIHSFAERPLDIPSAKIAALVPAATMDRLSDDAPVRIDRDLPMEPYGAAWLVGPTPRSPREVDRPGVEVAPSRVREPGARAQRSGPWLAGTIRRSSHHDGGPVRAARVPEAPQHAGGRVDQRGGPGGPGRAAAEAGRGIGGPARGGRRAGAPAPSLLRRQDQ